MRNSIFQYCVRVSNCSVQWHVPAAVAVRARFMKQLYRRQIFDHVQLILLLLPLLVMFVCAAATVAGIPKPNALEVVKKKGAGKKKNALY